ncbi:hypothetical protein HGA91_00165 [candidate division WWE3 bacterium]|nr:hypothetical protein [candidate division WWE3 bacterium]
MKYIPLILGTALFLVLNVLFVYPQYVITQQNLDCPAGCVIETGVPFPWKKLHTSSVIINIREPDPEYYYNYNYLAIDLIFWAAISYGTSYGMAMILQHLEPKTQLSQQEASIKPKSTRRKKGITKPKSK